MLGYGRKRRGRRRERGCMPAPGGEELRFTIGDIRRIDALVESGGVESLARADVEIHQLVFPVLREMAPGGDIENLVQILERLPPEIASQFESCTLSQLAAWWTLLIRDELYAPDPDASATDEP